MKSPNTQNQSSESRIPTNCPICHSTNGFSNTQVKIANGKIFTCDVCSGYFLFPPTHVEYNDSDWTKDHKENWATKVQEALTCAPAICKSIEKHLGRPVKSVLEIGCGTGFMGVGFSSAGCTYTGIDTDKESIEFAKDKGIDAHCLAAEEISQSPEALQKKYDLVLSAHAFEHFDDPFNAFQNLRVVSDGIIVIIVPNPKGLFQLIRSKRIFQKLGQFVLGNTREIAHSIDGYWHNIAYSERALQYMCNAADIKPLEIFLINQNHPTYGFVQRNESFLYKSASLLSSSLGMEAEIVLIAKMNN